jgi:hypothetical protein
VKEECFRIGLEVAVPIEPDGYGVNGREVGANVVESRVGYAPCSQLMASLGCSLRC